MNFRRKKRDKFDISVIPMIDVFMVLLIFFMITTTFNHQAALKIKLPEAKAPAVETEAKSVTVSIDRNGVYYLTDGDGQTRKLSDQNQETLRHELAALATQGTDMPFIISADGKTSHQAVMTALEMANEVGFSHIAFATQESPPEE